LAVFNVNPTLTGATFAGIIADNDDMVFEIDADNSGSNKYSFTDGASTEVASLTEAGVLYLASNIELGHATDTTLARSGAGAVTIEGVAIVLAGGAFHDGFSDFVANEHIDWTADQGATNIHAGNIPDLSGTYEPAGITAADISDKNAGTDITADLEEEAHAAEHAIGAADTVFPADPGFDAFLIWDDDPGALAFVAVTGYQPIVTEGSLSDSVIVSADIKDGTIAGGDLASNIAITSTGAQDFGGATSVEIPNGANPTVDAAGEIAQDTDGANEAGDVSLRAYDGTNTFLVARKLKTFSRTIVKPQDFADATRDLCVLWTNNTGMTFTITEIRAWSDTDNTTVTLEVVTATDFSAPATVDAVEIATNGTSVYTCTETTITDATIAHDEIITADFDDTDDPGWVVIEITGWYNAAVD
jgi:hypothetical protein